MTITILEDNILNSNEEYILHNCNCVSKYSKGLAKIIFDKYKYSNTYLYRKENSIPGTIDIMGNKNKNQRLVINLYGQYYPGKYNNSNDSYENRLKWFKQGLDKVSKIENIKSIAIPYNIGSGLAEGNFEDYLDIIKKLDEELNINIVFYKLIN